ncbi:MAG TPA: ABC transporter permease subunit [Pyrinomonadaceae bacterium]|nr:ABC transporter permease subunit [Pyrinomonadaceae bacterium]
MDTNAITTIARQELVINIRNRWTLVFAGVFGILVLAISYFGLVTAGTVGFQGFARTSASLLNLVLYIVPLVALTMGTLSFSSEKSASELLFSQPVSRGEILLGKFLGLFASIFTATLIGFGLAGVIIATKAGTEGSLRYPAFVGFSLLLALIFLSLSALIAALCQRKSKAFGVALFVWFFFVLFYDLLVIGLTFLLQERTANAFIFGSLFGNPVDMVRIASLITLNGKDIFGAGGAALLKFLGGESMSVALLLVALSCWVALPLFVAQKLLKHQDI